MTSSIKLIYENIGEAALLSYEHMKWILSADEPVEVKAKFIPDKYDHEDLKVESIRPLKPGEAIRHPYFKLPMHQIGL